ncbi:MAG TPA: helix-turn-helix transcriptional regulator [Phenylobacterium sp.]|nr:helix-turn-helix transcriptional regulator [Phenylobacterium sp.]
MKSSAFWNDLEEDLRDPEFLRAYVVESVRIATIDAIINDLEQARAAAHISKAALARSAGMDSAAVRRLLSALVVNPTLGTVAEIAAPLGLRLTLEPIPEAEQIHVTTPLISGQVADIAALRAHLAQLRLRRHQQDDAA